MNIFEYLMYRCCYSHSAMSDSSWPHRLQPTRLPCPPLSPGLCSNSCQWCHPTISFCHPLLTIYNYFIQGNLHVANGSGLLPFYNWLKRPGNKVSEFMFIFLNPFGSRELQHKVTSELLSGMDLAVNPFCYRLIKSRKLPLNSQKYIVGKWGDSWEIRIWVFNVYVCFHS